MPQIQSALMSRGLVPLRTALPPRVREKVCFPVPMGTVHAVPPAGASKVRLLMPELATTVPGDFSRATTKTESESVSAPSGRPWKKFSVGSETAFLVLSVESQVAELGEGRYQ